MSHEAFPVRPSRQLTGAALALFIGSLSVAAWVVGVHARLWYAILPLLVSLYALWYGLCLFRVRAERDVGWGMDGSDRPVFYATRLAGNSSIDEAWTIERVWLVAENFIFLQLRNNKGTQQPKALASDMMHPQAWRRFRVFAIRADHELRAPGKARRPGMPVA